MGIKIVLTTLPIEGQMRDWETPKHFRSSKAKYIHLGILSLASNISDKYDVTILDPQTYNWSVKRTIKEIEKINPDILGISAITRRAWALKEILQKTTIPYKIVGGPHTTYNSKYILEQGADAVFVGNLAEVEFNKVLETRVKGVIYCNKTDINKINFPNRSMLNIKDYFVKDKILFKSEKRLSMFSSIGCCNNCNFCNVQSKKLTLKSPKIIVDEMEYLKSIGAKSIHILDDNFNINPKHLKGILDEMQKRKFKIEWSGRGQVKMDFSLLPQMKATGFKRIHVGIESLEDSTLKYFNKPQNVRDIIKFCDEMKKYKIEVLGYFILGAPIETKEYRKNLPKMIRDLGINYPYFNILFPEPDTEYYRSLLKEGYYKYDFWKDFMKTPTKDFVPPYQYGEEKKKQIVKYVNKLIKEFKNN